MYSGIYYGFDPTVLLLIIGVILSLVASSRLKSTFATYSRVRSASGDDRGSGGTENFKFQRAV